MKPLLLSLLFVSSIASSQNFKTAFNQLVYVNEQWLNQADVDVALKQTAAKPMNEQQLIQFHLQETEKLLRKRNVHTLTAAQQKQREQNLNTLHSYWRQGVFPVNDGHLNRQPYFIDKYNTYCAVGYLMQQSGADAIARRIHNNQNFSYLFDIKHPQLMTWAQQSGLTLNELALIQPAYSYDRPACVLELHYNNAGTDVGEYIEIQQPLGMMSSGPVTHVAFYNSAGVLYKTVDTAQMQVLSTPGVYSYLFPSTDSFADAGSITLLTGNNIVAEFILYDTDSVHIEDAYWWAPGSVRTYYVGENESTPAGTSLTFCGHTFSGGPFNLTLQSLSATPGTVNSCTILPVSFSDFNYRIAERTVQLTWRTAMESNTKSFIIERSKDGTNFTSLGNVQAAGNSNTARRYALTDNKPRYINHYRIKQVDADGRASYSKLLFVKVPHANPLEILSAGKDNIRVNIALEQADIASLLLYDFSGRMLVKFKPANGEQTLPLNTVPTGSYLLQLSSKDGQVFNQQVVK